MKNTTAMTLTAALTLLLAGCPEEGAQENNAGGNDTENNVEGYVPPTLDEVPATYAFPSKFVEGDSGVRYNGQTMRHVLIFDLNDYIANRLEEDALASRFADQAAVELVFTSFLESEDLSEEEIRLSTEAGTLQTTYGELSSGTLLQKIAGNDSSTDYKDWKTGLEGWEGQTSAEGLVRDFFDQLAGQVFALQEGAMLKDPISDQDLPVYVTPEGLDLKQLIQKFLLMSIGFAQAADDYMASGTPDKGLEAPNTRSGDSVYTGLEHVWDEGFGYFGAARDYDTYSDQEISDGVRKDSDGDGVIDLKSEYNFGASVNAAKRDLGSADGAATDYTRDAFDAFRAGRLIIYQAGEELTEDEKTRLEAERDKALGAWEKAIAATVVHYINDTLQVMRAYEEQPITYSHAEHAKVWSELKGFSLGFQFNEASPMMQDSEATGVKRFVAFHTLIGDAPALPTPGEADGGDAFQSYADDLVAARDILQEAYGFDDANMGDEDGENGW